MSMDWLLSLFSSEDDIEKGDDKKDKQRDLSKDSATAFIATKSAEMSTREANVHFAKSSTYDRKLYEDSAVMKNTKIEAFGSSVKVRDPYSNKELVLTKAEAKQRFGSDWQKHLAESDHTKPLHKIHQEHKNDAWTTQDDLKEAANSKGNMQVISREHNNAKRGRTEEEFVNDDKYLKKTGVKISNKGKEKAVEAGKKADLEVERQLAFKKAQNMVKTGHEAGAKAATSAGQMTFAISTIQNIQAVMNGDKDAAEAFIDTAKDTTKSAAVAYMVSGNATVIGHTLSSSSSNFLQSLQDANVPAKVIVGVMQFGDLFKRLGNGEITSQEFVLGIGERGLNIATAGYSMAVGQALIPIPVVGAAVGAIIGSAMTSKMFHSLIEDLQRKELEHQERMRLLAQYKQATEQMRIYHAQLEEYSKLYFQDCRTCFETAINELDVAFRCGDAEGVIVGANRITEKLGGQVKYRNMQEFKAYLADDIVDIL